jgi:3-oxoadipate enol-lactonase
MMSDGMMLDDSAIRIDRQGSGPPLVLLHCLGVDHRLWRLAAGLESEFTVLSYDFPGHGATPVPGHRYTIEDLSAQLLRLLDREGVARAHLGGISLGGLVAQHFAATHPERVERVMLIDTTPRYTDDARANWAVRAAQARGAGVASLLETLLPVWFTPDFIAVDGAAVRYVRDCFHGDSGEGYALACEALAAADLRPLVPKIAAPTLIVCGEQDVPPFLDAARWLNAAIAGSRIQWLAPARHASVLQQPAAFVAAARVFLAG